MRTHVNETPKTANLTRMVKKPHYP